MSMIEVSKPTQQSHAADPAELEEQMREVVRDTGQAIIACAGNRPISVREP
jgi:hypothetical protein